MTPNWSLNDHRIMVAVITGAMVNGKQDDRTKERPAEKRLVEERRQCQSKDQRCGDRSHHQDKRVRQHNFEKDRIRKDRNVLAEANPGLQTD